MMKRSLIVICAVIVVLLAVPFAASADGSVRTTSGKVVGDNSSTPPILISDGGDDQCDGDADDIAGIKTGIALTVGVIEPGTVWYHNLILDMYRFIIWLR